MLAVWTTEQYLIWTQIQDAELEKLSIRRKLYPAEDRLLVDYPANKKNHATDKKPRQNSELEMSQLQKEGQRQEVKLTKKT